MRSKLIFAMTSMVVAKLEVQVTLKSSVRTTRRGENSCTASALLQKGGRSRSTGAPCNVGFVCVRSVMCFICSSRRQESLVNQKNVFSISVFDEADPPSTLVVA